MTIDNNSLNYLKEQLEGADMSAISKVLVKGVDIPFPSKKELTQEEIIMALGVEMPSSPVADRKNNQIAAKKILFSQEYQMENALDWVRKFNGSDPIPNIEEDLGEKVQIAGNKAKLLAEKQLKLFLETNRFKKKPKSERMPKAGR